MLIVKKISVILKKYWSSYRENLNFFINIVLLGITIYALVLALKGLPEAKVQLDKITELTASEKNAASQNLTVLLDDRLSAFVNTKIISSIDQNKPILDPKDPYSYYKLNNYMGTFEILDQAYRADVIRKDDICNIFSDFIDITSENKEIQNYLIDEINSDPQNLTGYRDLVKVNSESCH